MNKNIRLLCIILIICALLVACKNTKTDPLRFLNYDPSDINSITIRTQMIEGGPIYLITESEEDIATILEMLRKLKFTLVDLDPEEREKGWEFVFIIDSDKGQQSISLNTKRAYAYSPEDYDVDSKAYDLEGYDVDGFLDLFNSIDVEKKRLVID